MAHSWDRTKAQNRPTQSGFETARNLATIGIDYSLYQNLKNVFQYFDKRCFHQTGLRYHNDAKSII